MNILFVCSRNKWRSRTAETIYKNQGTYSFKSAGTENSARIRVNLEHINWADIIFVMEKKHKQRIQEKFDLNSRDYNFVILDIEDNYQYMDEDVIQILKDSVDPYL